MLLGNIVGCLGIFHFMQRMVKTMRSTHTKYWEAIVALKECVYYYHDDDMLKVLKALKNGTMSRKKKKYSTSEIHDLQRSKKWKQ